MNRNHRIDLNHATFYWALPGGEDDDDDDVDADEDHDDNDNDGDDAVADDDGDDDDDDANATSSVPMHVFAHHVKHCQTAPENPR